jgi:uncharacterized OsmC-like protein
MFEAALNDDQGHEEVVAWFLEFQSKISTLRISLPIQRSNKRSIQRRPKKVNSSAVTEAAFNQLTRGTNPMTQATVETKASATLRQKRERTPINGVNTPALFETLGVVRENPGLADFTFRARNEWISGTYNRTTFTTFSGAGGDHQHEANYTAESDHPTVLVGGDRAPTPVEHVLHALSSCLMSGAGNIASARGIRLDSIECEISGDINLLGLLGLNDTVRNGYRSLSLSFRIKGDAKDEELRNVIEQAKARSAVYDIVTNGVPVEINTETV